MPDMKNNVINNVAKYLYQQGVRPTPSMAQTEFQKQLFMKNLQNEQKFRKDKQYVFEQAMLKNTTGMTVQVPQQQRYNEQQKNNQAMNIALMVNKLITQGHKLSDLMTAATQFLMQARMDEQENMSSGHEHKAKGKEHSKEGANNDGSSDDEFLADVDGDGVVTDFERKNLENFLVTKVQENEPTFKVETFKIAQESGEPMEGAEAAAKELVRHVLESSPSAAATQAATPKKSALSPFPMKPTPKPPGGIG